MKNILDKLRSKFSARPVADSATQSLFAVSLVKRTTFASKLFLKVDRRVRFVASALILGFLMLISTFFPFSFTWILVPLLVGATFLFTYFSILEGIDGIEWVMLFVMPVIFTLALYFFYYLFPVRWLTRIPFVVIYVISIYAILLTSNIFNVGVEKSLQLYRAAFAVNYFYQTVVMFLLFNTLFSLKAHFWVNGVGVGLLTIPLGMQFLWTIRLKLEIEPEVVAYALCLALIMAEFAVIASFVPFEASVVALVLTSIYYSIGGLFYSHIDQRFFRETVRGYLFIMAFILALAFLSLSW